MHRFWVTKPPAAYGTEDPLNAEQAADASPAQLLAIREIAELLRTIAMRCVGPNGLRDAVSAKSPFVLLEMHADIASLIGLRAHCWVMLELSGQSPTVIFEDRDLVLLKRMSVTELECAASALHHQLDNPTGFALLTRQ